MNFVIDPEIKGLLPPLTDNEAEDLEQSLLDNGCMDPIKIGVLDGNRILIDGHNRYEICDRNSIFFPAAEVYFSTREEMIAWVIRNQLSRRNLTDAQKAYYRGKEYLNNRKSQGNPQLGHNVPIGNSEDRTSEIIAEKNGVNEKTIRRDAEFAEAVDAMTEPEKKAILTEQSDLTKKDVVNGKKPILCDRCQRVGVIKDCLACKEARSAAKRKPKTDPEHEPEEPEIPCDYNGVPWADKAPKALIAIKAEPQLSEMARQLSKMAKTIADDESLRLYTYSMQSVVSSIRNIRSTLVDALPAYICPYCDGTLRTIEGSQRGKPCDVCNREGWVAKSTYRRSPKGYSEK